MKVPARPSCRVDPIPRDHHYDDTWEVFVSSFVWLFLPFLLFVRISVEWGCLLFKGHVAFFYFNCSLFFLLYFEKMVAVIYKICFFFCRWQDWKYVVTIWRWMDDISFHLTVSHWWVSRVDLFSLRRQDFVISISCQFRVFSRGLSPGSWAKFELSRFFFFNTFVNLWQHRWATWGFKMTEIEWCDVQNKHTFPTQIFYGAQGMERRWLAGCNEWVDGVYVSGKNEWMDGCVRGVEVYNTIRAKELRWWIARYLVLLC